MREDRRALSTVVGYTLAVAVTAALAAGLVTAIGDEVDRRQSSVGTDGLEVAGGRVVAGIEAADRLAVTNATTATVEVPLPERIAGSSYRVVVDPGTPASELQLSAPDADASVTLRFTNRTAVASSRVGGGDLEVVLTGAGELEVRAA